MYGQDFSDFFVTKLQANDFCGRISGISQQVYEAGFDLSAKLATEFGVVKRDKLMMLLREDGDLTDNRSIQKWLEKIISQTKSLPTVTLTVAFVPNDKNLKHISSWLLQNLNKQVLIEFNVDRSILAGARVNYNGKYSDQSVLASYQKVLEKEIKAT